MDGWVGEWAGGVVIKTVRRADKTPINNKGHKRLLTEAQYKESLKNVCQKMLFQLQKYQKN